jgi:hypothetical protein
LIFKPLTNQLWNARLQRRTFKNDEFTAYVMVRDILNQNIGINRFIYENTIGEERNDRLKRYDLVLHGILKQMVSKKIYYLL